MGRKGDLTPGGRRCGDAPAVSVVIPAYRASQYIGDAVESVLGQTFNDYEVIVVNDGSPDTDELERALEPYRERIIYIKQENRGPGGARNAAIRSARGEYVAFLDADDCWEPAYLAEQVAFIDGNPEVVFVYADALLAGDTPLAGRTFMETAPSVGEPTFESLLRGRCEVILSGVIARKEEIAAAGMFDEDIRQAEDYDLWLRLARRGGRLAYQRKVLLRKRIHADSQGGDCIRLFESALDVLDKVEREMALTLEERDALESQRVRISLRLNQERGKLALSGGDYEAAAAALREANRLRPSLKARLALALLKVSPRLLARAHGYYSRLRKRGRRDKGAGGGKPSLTTSATWLIFAKTLAFAVSFALPLLLVRKLSQQEFGLYKQVFLVVGTAMFVLPLGFGMSAFYYLPRERERQGQVVFNVLLFNGAVGILACAALCLRPSMLGAIFNGPELVEFAPLIGVVILLWVVSSFLEIVPLAHQEAKLATLLIISVQVSKTLLLLSAAILYGTVRALIYAAILQGVFQTLVLLLYLRSRFHGFWRGFEWSMVGAQLSYALPLGIASVMLRFQSDLDNYFVSHQFGPAAFAIYAIGCFNLPLVSILGESVGSVLIPRVSHLQKLGRSREIIEVIARMMRKLSAVYFLICAYLLVTGQEFITLLFTSQYISSWPIFAINLIQIPLSIITSGYDPVIRAYAEHRYFLIKVRVVLLVLLSVQLWFFLGRFGMLGAITAVVSASLIERLVTGYKAARILGATRRDFALVKDVGKLALAAAMAAVPTALVRSLMLGADLVLILGACAITMSVSYLMAMSLLRVFTPEELTRLRNQLSRLQRLARWKRLDAPLPGGAER